MSTTATARPDRRPTARAVRRRARHPFRRVVLAGAAVPVLVAGQFALMAVIPIAMASVTTWRYADLRRLRPWTATLAALYALALAMWAVGPDRAESLSKDIDPLVAIAISIAGLALAARSYLLRAQTRKEA